MSQPPSSPFRLAQLTPQQLDRFVEEIDALRAEIDASLGEDDLTHLKRIERIGRACTVVGLLTAGVAPNPVSAVCLSVGRSTRWLLMHHVGHRGYDKVPNVPAKYTSKVFARGKRRFLDWPDWMIPEAWIYEHNVLHHSYTGEEEDPDLIERNATLLRDKGLPMSLRYGLLVLLGMTWRSTYYAPNTLRTWLNRPAEVKRRAKERHMSLEEAVAGDKELNQALWRRCYLPYAVLHFGVLPLPYLAFGPWSAFSALCNSLMAEALTNLHTFCVVGPNHTGDDLYRFEDRPASKAEHYVRQIIGSVNFRTGNDWIDFPHLWLNYQIEHHIWPDIPMLKYQQVQPKVEALCQEYGIPYLQEGVFSRVKKMMDVAVGKTSMRWFSREDVPA
jgi:fatty acid desaturase